MESCFRIKHLHTTSYTNANVCRFWAWTERCTHQKNIRIFLYVEIFTEATWHRYPYIYIYIYIFVYTIFACIYLLIFCFVLTLTKLISNETDEFWNMDRGKRSIQQRVFILFGGKRVKTEMLFEIRRKARSPNLQFLIIAFHKLQQRCFNKNRLAYLHPRHDLGTASHWALSASPPSLEIWWPMATTSKFITALSDEGHTPDNQRWTFLHQVLCERKLHRPPPATHQEPVAELFRKAVAKPDLMRSLYFAFF